MLILASAAVHAAEQPGTLSKKRRRLAPRVDTSKTSVNSVVSRHLLSEAPKPAAQPIHGVAARRWSASGRA